MPIKYELKVVTTDLCEQQLHARETSPSHTTKESGHPVLDEGGR